MAIENLYLPLLHNFCPSATIIDLLWQMIDLARPATMIAIQMSLTDKSQVLLPT